MKTLRYLSVIPLLIALSVSCSDSSGPDVTVADLAGTWTATQFRITDESGTLPPFDIVSPLIGGSLEITVTVNGMFSGTLQATSQSALSAVAGSITIQGDLLTLTFTQGLDNPISGESWLVGDTLRIIGTDLTVEFEGQTIDSATIILALERQ